MSVFNRVFSSSLDSAKHWYALNPDICGTDPRKFSTYRVFKIFPGDIERVNIKELTTSDRSRVPAKWFLSSKASTSKNRFENVFIASTFGILAGVLSSCKEGKSKTLDSLSEVILKIQYQRLDGDGTNAASKETTNFNINWLSSPDFQGKSSTPKAKKRVFEESPPKSPPKIPSKCPPKFESSFSSTSTVSDEYSILEIKNSDFTPAVKKRKIRKTAKGIISEIQELCLNRRETLASVLAECCVIDSKGRSFARETITHVVDEVVKRKGCERAFKDLISEEAMETKYAAIRVPDWQHLLLKLESRISDKSWQTIINRTNLGRNKAGTPVLPLKNHVKAVRAMIGEAVVGIMGLRPLPKEIPGFQVSLKSAIVWSAREQRLHGCVTDELEFHLKLDGRPLFGKEQINLGIVPAKHPYLSSQSSKAVSTIAIANCQESRPNIKNMIIDVNNEKDQIKKCGICIDGKIYQVKFKVILDYKGFCLLMKKVDDDEFQLGGKGLDVSFCMFCTAIRLCTDKKCDVGPNEVCLEHFSMTKANIGGFKGIRDDLTFLLEEDMTSVNICALHCEMRNMECLLASMGLLCHEIGSLKECNNVLSFFGPQTFKGDRITVKAKPGQESCLKRHNVKVASFSGSTERSFLNNCEEIVEESLPKDRLIDNHFTSRETAEIFILNQVTYCSERIKYYQTLKEKGTFTRDCGNHQEDISINNQAVGMEIDNILTSWSEKRNEISQSFKTMFDDKRSKPKGKIKKSTKSSDSLRSYAADLLKNLYLEVFTQWREIALTIRNAEFGQDQEHLIDKFDLKCKEWGFLLRHLYGPRLGTGDYAHMVIDHASMLLRVHRSIGKMSNQGFEANHKIHRQLYAQATSHDSPGHITSLQQMISHQYSELLLFQRLCFREAIVSVEKGTPFFFKGCYWMKSHKVTWSADDRRWLYEMDNLFTLIFSGDSFNFVYTKKKGDDGKMTNGKCIIDPKCLTTFIYDHDKWEKEYSTPPTTSSSKSPVSSSPPTTSSPNSSSKSPNSSTKSPVSSSPPTTSSPNSSSKSPNSSTKSPVSSSPPTTSSPNSSSKPSVSCSPPTTSSPKSSSPVSSFPMSSSPPTPSSPNSSPHNLILCTVPGVTRGQMSSITLPPVFYITDDQVKVVKGGNKTHDPFTLPYRPAENIVSNSLKLLRKAADKQGTGILTNTTGFSHCIQLGVLGKFDYTALEVYDAFCKTARVQRKVFEELAWVKDDMIKDVLLSMRPNEEFLRVGNIFMDATDFSNLACERYIDGNTIDISCLTFLEANKPSCGVIIYLPSYMPTWASCGTTFLLQKLSPLLPEPGSCNVVKILCPIHVNMAHWGLLYVDVVGGKMFYDDGLHIPPPRNFQLIVNNLMKVLRTVYPSCLSLVTNKWSSYEQFGMPTQPSQGDGSSSCGIGVVFAVRDIIAQVGRGMPKIQWTFHDSSALRRQVMKQLILIRNK